jgi:hypothetical protein
MTEQDQPEQQPQTSTQADNERAIKALHGEPAFQPKIQSAQESSQSSGETPASPSTGSTDGGNSQE